MRKDMFKVIVERSRLGGGHMRPGRRHRSLEDLPVRESIKTPLQRSGKFKKLNEHLQPLRRFLHKQVGRPWAKVYSEISRELRVDSAVQQHVRDHITDFVATHVFERKGKLFFTKPESGHTAALHGSSLELWVDPHTGILRKNRHVGSWRRERRKRMGMEKRERLKRMVVASKTLQYHRLSDDAWWAVELAPLPKRKELRANRRGDLMVGPLDAVLEAGMSDLSPEDLYGQGDVYAKSKRQLSSKDVRRLGLPIGKVS